MTSVGDVIADGDSIATTALLTVQPPAGEEWVIHNIYHASDVTLIKTDGAYAIEFDSEPGAGLYAKYAFHLTNTDYLTVRNDDAETMDIAFDGVVTKAAP